MKQSYISLIRVLGSISLGLGFDPRKFIATILNSYNYFSDLILFTNLSKIKKNKGNYGSFPIQILPILSDKSSDSGSHGVYFYQDLQAAKLIYNRNPERHLDIGSRLDGFISHLLSFRSVYFADIRPLQASIPGLHFIQFDVMDTEKSRSLLNTFDSISCLHALEHFGLGRYSDPLNPDGWELALANIINLLTNDGLLYLSVPLGRQRVEFNSQRIFNPHTILKFFELNSLECISFYHITNDTCHYIDLDDHSSFEHITRLDCDCGLFIAKKRLSQQ